MNSRIITDHPQFGRSLWLDNGVLELVIPLDWGIRIARLAYVGGENVFVEQSADMTDFTTPEGWRLRGGHRLWVSPESDADYYPDNDPVEYALTDKGVKLIQKPDPLLGVEKSMELTLEENRVRVLHGIKNVASSTVECALWTMSVMAPGGTERIPLPEVTPPAWTPRFSLTFWPYTDPADPRFRAGENELTVTHLPMERRFKLGVSHPARPVTFGRNGVVFSVDWDTESGSAYPDGGCSFETFFSRQMTEIETLSPLKTIAPGESAFHEERWELIRN